MIHALLFRLRRLVGLPRANSEVTLELELHRDLLIDEYCSRGLSLSDAQATAERELGGYVRTRETLYNEMTWPGLAAAGQDIRYALRGFRKTAGFTLTAVVVLAIGIGLNVGVFSILNALAFRPLPLPEAEQLVTVAAPHRRLSWPVYQSFRDGGISQLDLAAYDYDNSLLAGAGTARPAQSIRAGFVSPNFFELLGEPARLGRTPGSHDVTARRAVVLSDHYWRSRFSSDTAAVGSTLVLNRESFLVAGIMPAAFHGTDLVVPDVWLTFDAMRELRLSAAFEDPGNHHLLLVGRLRRGDFGQAEAALTSIATRLAPPRTNGRADLGPVTLSRAVYFPLSTELMPWVILLMVPTGLVLLAACANLANLLFARTTARRGEIATRLALGAGRGRVVRQLMTECLLLAVFGGAAGALLASQLLHAATTLLQPFVSSMILPPFLMDMRVLLFTFSSALVAAVVCGLLPALSATRQNLAAASRHSKGSGDLSHRRLRNVLMGAQLAVCAVLLIVAGLMLRSFQSALATTPGFTTENIAVLQLDLAPAFSKAAAATFATELSLRLASLPRVVSVASAATPPLSDSPALPVYLRDIGTSEERQAITSSFNSVTPEYFQTLDIPLLAGRNFTSAETQNAARVAIISQATAQRLWPGQGAIGRRLRLETDPPGSMREVIGIVRDTRSVWLSRPDESYIYLPLEPLAALQRPVATFIRFSGQLPVAMEDLRGLLRVLAPELPVRIQPLSAVLGRWRLIPLGASLLATGLGLLSIALAAVGLYGVIGYLVRQREREFGIRFALGATPARVVRGVLREGFRVVAIGLSCGLAVAAFGARFAMGTFYGVNPNDPTVFAGVALFLGMVSLVAMLRPARTAGTVDPASTLRAE